MNQPHAIDGTNADRFQDWPPESMTHHPAADVVPMLPHEHPEFQALLESVNADGIQERLLVDSKRRILNGRHRNRCAKLLKHATVPVEIVPDAQAATIAMQTALGRRQFDKGQKAMLIAMLFESTAEEREKRRISNLKQGKNDQLPKISATGKSTLLCDTDLAGIHGISADYMQMARRIQEEAPNEIAAIMAGEKQLYAVCLGLHGKAATKKQPKRGINYAKALPESWGTLVKYTRTGWDSMPGATRIRVLTLARKLPGSVPEEVLAELKRGIKDAEKSSH